MSKIKAILIDPVKQEVSSIEIEVNDYRDVAYALRCKWSELGIVKLAHGDVVAINEDAAEMGVGATIGGFSLPVNGQPVEQPFAGYGLVAGYTENDEFASPSAMLQWVGANVQFLSKKFFI